MKKSLGAKTLLYPTPVLVVGTYDTTGQPNVMTASWGGLCCSNPPCVAVSLRKATYSHGNIVAQKAFTINIPSQSHLKAVDYFGLVSGRLEDKLKAAGLTAMRSALVNAPYIQEFPVVLECQLVHTLELGLHTHFIGQIMDVKAESTVVGADNLTNIELVKPFLFEPDTQRYFAVGPCLGQAFSVGRDL